MNLFALPIGSIIVGCCLGNVPPGWKDITGSLECIEQIHHFQTQYPHVREFEDRDPLFCIKKIAEAGTS